MDNKTNPFYEELAAGFENWYGVDKEKVIALLKEHGEEYVFNNAEVLGLDQSRCEALRKIYEIICLCIENKEVFGND